jgi:hypothetical protein
MVKAQVTEKVAVEARRFGFARKQLSEARLSGRASNQKAVGNKQRAARCKQLSNAKNAKVSAKGAKKFSSASSANTFASSALKL